jgi:lipopolysaccharide assembly outer membrane protein LptD (OstA)
MLMGLTAAVAATAHSPISFAQAKGKGAPLLPTAGKAPAAAPQTARKPGETYIRVTAEESEIDEATQTTHGTNATVTDLEEGTVFKAADVKVDQRPKFETLVATGSPSITDKQADITGDKAVANFAKSKRILTVTGNVVILVKPKQKDGAADPVTPMNVAVQDGKAVAQPGKKDESAASARKHPATITCDQVVYHYAKDKKHAILTGNFKVVQKLPTKTRTLTAKYADWFGNEERILLHGPVEMEDSKGTRMTTPEQVTIFTAEGKENIKMRNAIILTPKSEIEEEEDAPATPPGTPPAGTPAPQPAKPEERKP